ncbi:NUDIX hydrolase [Aureimonas fodinaquatilis]|uniref:NUDIX hydrolase n=1 Tax=Aureimonas fodinaquatilis TaxID=2565783 RepID=UPI001FE797C6|nr:hypothetical protein [Aureimonas fodinaquatilis]
MTANAVHADLLAVLAAVDCGQPLVLTTGGGKTLPSGPFEVKHRSLQLGLRTWVEQQTHHPLGYLEQLYTFADLDRGVEDGRVISISYLGLTRRSERAMDSGTGWIDWYRYFPWEDYRAGTPACVTRTLAPALEKNASKDLRQRAARAFGLDGHGWNEEFVLQRYELLYEAGLVAEALRDKGSAEAAHPDTGFAMHGDHRRILATGVARLRAKIKYRPVVFELMPPAFTLLQLQRSVEALSGRLAHKQNFRRLIEQQELVEETGQMASDTGGRPAKLFHFRREIVDERAFAGTKMPLVRA